MKCDEVARQRQQPVSAQAHVRNADVKPGQAVSTSGLGEIFPKGIMTSVRV